MTNVLHIDISLHQVTYMVAGEYGVLYIAIPPGLYYFFLFMTSYKHAYRGHSLRTVNVLDDHGDS